MLIDKARTERKPGVGPIRMAWWLMVDCGRKMKCLVVARWERKTSRERKRWMVVERRFRGVDLGKAGGALASGTCLNDTRQVLLRTPAGVDYF
jgi:hypothetical protein